MFFNKNEQSKNEKKLLFIMDFKLIHYLDI